MKHVDGTLYLITFEDDDGVAVKFLEKTIQECTDAIHDACYHREPFDNGQRRKRSEANGYWSCKVRAIHDADGIVRDVTEDIANVMMDDLFDGYVGIYDWPIWAELMGLKRADFGFEVEPDYDPHEYF